MTKFDFDEIIDRRNTNSFKYDLAKTANPYLANCFIPMWIADMDFAVPEVIRDAMKARIDKKILGYSMCLSHEYYEAVESYMHRHYGHNFTAENVVFSSGVITAMEVAVQTFTKPTDGIIINTPAYHPFDDSVKKYGRTPVYSPLRNTDGYYTFDFEDFEEKAKCPTNTMFFLCNPHNPSGRVWREEELRRIADICFRNNVYIFSDEIHCDITRRGEKHIPLAVLYPNEKRMLTATAPSKTFNIAGNQLSNIIMSDTDVAADWREYHRCGLPNPCSIDACIAAYTKCDDWLSAMNDYVEANLVFVGEYLSQHLPRAVYRVPQGTYLAWVDLSAYGHTDLQLKKAISAAGLYIQYADEFVANGEGHVRINTACPRATLVAGLEILCKTVSGM